MAVLVQGGRSCGTSAAWMSRRDTIRSRSGCLSSKGASSEPQLLMMILDLDAIMVATFIATLTMATSLVGHTGISPRWQHTARRPLSLLDAEQKYSFLEEVDVSPMSQASWPEASKRLCIF